MTVEPTALLTAATPECAVEVRRVGDNPVCTQDGETFLGDDQTATRNLWKCNGAIMGPREQACLTAAKARVPQEAIGEEAIPK